MGPVSQSGSMLGESLAILEIKKYFLRINEERGDCCLFGKMFVF